MFKKIFTVLVFVCMIFSVARASEDIMKTPNMEILHSEIIYANNERIIGMMKVRNNTDAYFPDVYYSLGMVSYEPISSEDETIKDAFIVGSSEPVKFSIGANQEKDIYFSYDVPKYLPEYVNELMMTFSTRTMSLSFGENSIILEPGIEPVEEGFLFPNFRSEFATWEIGKEVARADTGPNITSSSKPIAKLTLQSWFEDEITVRPKITIYQRSKEYNSVPMSSTIGKEIKFSAKEEKEVKINVPVMTNPESYLVRIEFINENDDVVSHEYDFRYVVKGLNAKIIETYLTDKNDELKLNIFAIGSADGDTKLNDGSLSCEIVSKEGTIIYSEKFVAHLGKILGRKIIPLERFEGIVTIKLKLEKNGQVFDEFSFDVNLNRSISNDLSFTDIKDSRVKKAAEVLSSIGMISGYPDGTFRPNNNITRAEFTVIATRLLGVKCEESSPSVFWDVPNEHWAKDFINLAEENGCISGYTDGSFKPDNNVTIAESITILINVLEYKEKVAGTGKSWPFNYLDVANDLELNKNTAYNSYMEPATRGNVSIMTLNSYLHKLSIGGI